MSGGGLRGTSCSAYPKLFISNGIVTRVSVWHLTFCDTRTLGELLFGHRQRKKHPLDYRPSLYLRHNRVWGFPLSPYACGNLGTALLQSCMLYHISRRIALAVRQQSCSAVLPQCTVWVVWHLPDTTFQKAPFLMEAFKLLGVCI